MIKRTLTGSLFVLLVIGLLVQPLAAGGWTVVTLDQLPLHIKVGEPISVSFQVQQHGITPVVLPAGEVVVMARQISGDESIRAVAEATDPPGHYRAEVTFPSPGLWSWSVRPGGFPTADMPDLTVAPSPIQPLVEKRPEFSEWDGWWQVLYELIAALRPPPEPAMLTPATSLAVDDVAYGKALFVAKGCATCHLHDKVETQFSTEVGPELTDYMVIPAYVKVWLSDPTAVKPATLMPKLHLNEAEIDALVAFLSDAQE